MNYTISQLAYLAAMIEGEGSISMCDKVIRKRKSLGIRRPWRPYRARVNFSTMVVVTNTDIRLMHWLVLTFGGIISSSKERQKPNWKQRHTWVMPNPKISYFLKLLLPYFIIKRKQAELMIEARKTFDDNPKAIQTSDEVYSRRFEICHHIRLLNQRGLPPCCPSP